MEQFFQWFIEEKRSYSEAEIAARKLPRRDLMCIHLAQDYASQILSTAGSVTPMQALIEQPQYVRDLALGFRKVVGEVKL